MPGKLIGLSQAVARFARDGMPYASGADAEDRSSAVSAARARARASF